MIEEKDGTYTVRIADCTQEEKRLIRLLTPDERKEALLKAARALLAKDTTAQAEGAGR